MSYQAGYNDGVSQARADRALREFMEGERAAGRGVTPEGLASLLVLAICLAIPAVAVWGLHAWLGQTDFFTAHPRLVKAGYGVFAVLLFSACVALHRVIQVLLRLAFLAVLVWWAWGLVAMLIFDGIH